jgi:hypothetical protein
MKKHIIILSALMLISISIFAQIPPPPPPPPPPTPPQGVPIDGISGIITMAIAAWLGKRYYDKE